MTTSSLKHNRPVDWKKRKEACLVDELFDHQDQPISNPTDNNNDNTIPSITTKLEIKRLPTYFHAMLTNFLENRT